MNVIPNNESPSEIIVEISEDLALLANLNQPKDYPTSDIRKGLIISWKGVDLCDEGVGFGVPILKFGNEAVFPGRSRSKIWKQGDLTTIEVEFDLNLVSKLANGRRLIETKTLYKTKGHIDRLHREHPFMRRAITLTSKLFRRALSLETRLVDIGTVCKARVVYIISQNGKINVYVKCGQERKGCTEMVIMNEMGGNYFDHYIDSEGMNLQGEEIGSWENTSVDWAKFVDSHHNSFFKLWKTEGADLFFGREVRSGLLAWSGFAHIVYLPEGSDFKYEIELGASQ